MCAVKLAGLEPASVFGFFEEICSIPHGSRNTKAISDYLASFARARNLRYVQDEANNVIIFQEGTCGYEDHAPVILQGHMDMVCEKDASCPLDMAVDGLDVAHDATFSRSTLRQFRPLMTALSQFTARRAFIRSDLKVSVWFFRALSYSRSSKSTAAISLMEQVAPLR